jgi:hypothetical protein
MAVEPEDELEDAAELAAELERQAAVAAVFQTRVPIDVARWASPVAARLSRVLGGGDSPRAIGVLLNGVWWGFLAGAILWIAAVMLYRSWLVTAAWFGPAGGAVALVVVFGLLAILQNWIEAGRRA